jgi:hypothetical protein
LKTKVPAHFVQNESEHDDTSEYAGERADDHANISHRTACVPCVLHVSAHSNDKRVPPLPAVDEGVGVRVPVRDGVAVEVSVCVVCDDDDAVSVVTDNECAVIVEDADDVTTAGNSTH